MTTLSAATPVRAAAPARRTALRWLATFPGFPLGGLAAMALVGPVDSTTAAVTGGLLTGAVLGGAQALGLGLRGRSAAAGVAATALGLGAGLALGSGAVGHAADLGDLAVQGAVSGAVVGLAQAALVRRRDVRLATLWPAFLAAAWALGWTLTTLVGVAVEERFTVFGAAGAVTVTALTTVLPLRLRPRP